jgi:DNA-binding NtrC family response regulator
MPPRILIVDDEERFRLTLSKRLAERGLDVGATVGTGMEALREIREKVYDVVVLDVKMPGLDGIQILEEIKKINPHIEVLLLTGHASVDAAVDGMRLGAYDYLMKPCEIEILLDKITGAYECKAGREERIRQAEIRSRTDREPA